MSATVRRLIRLGVLSILVVMLTASAAQAVSWGTVRAYYDGIARAEGKGNFYNEGYQNARNDFWLNDPSNDGNNAAGHTRFLFYYSGGWHYEGSKSTGEWSYFNTPTTVTLRFPLDAIGTAARGASKVCGLMGFPIPDVCSNEALPSFNY